MAKRLRRSKTCAAAFTPVLKKLEARLIERGYKQTTTYQHLLTCEHFIDYLVRGRVDIGSLNEGGIDTYVRREVARIARRRSARRRAPSSEVTRWRWQAPLRLLLQELRRARMSRKAPRPRARHPIVAGFSAFLESHRGLSQGTIRANAEHVERLLQHAGIRNVSALHDLTVEQIDRFLIESARGRSRSAINSISSSIRAFLRYAHQRGLRDTDLSGAVTSPRVYSFDRLPRFLPWSDVERLLASGERTTQVGCRDYAILVLLALCGLRAGEVAGLELEHIDWKHERICVGRRKSNSVENVPLVPVIGEALREYLSRRPKVAAPQFFLKVLAPSGPVSSAGISQLVKRRLKSANIVAPHWGSHTLRHSFAVELLRQGLPLKTIGDALGHHNPDATFIYAKTAVEELRDACLTLKGVMP
jgi:site-specific recombinase XerD